MFFVYILSSEKIQRSYVGSTNDLERRFKEHNSGKSKYTKSFMPWKLIYTEKCDSLLDARKRERYFKTVSGRKVVKEIFNKK